MSPSPKSSYVELLAPCGSAETVAAAIAGGADAVYLGGTSFSARMYAKNFDHNALAQAISLCHKNRVAVYVTVNTQLYDRECAQALRYAYDLYEMGADAIICADLGFAQLLHRHLPDFPLHASTQLSGHNAQAAKLLHDIGFCRMVCAREMRRQDIVRLCEQSPIEIEQFVHGALCASHSGQCLLSAMMGGRSGNRGMCAQPCRQSYCHSYPLSLKDLCLAAHLTEVCDSGVTSLKIEGRMKNPDYVYGVVRLFRQLLEQRRNATAAEISELARLFSRGGSFTDGYYTDRIGPAMLGVRTEADKQASRAQSHTAQKRTSYARSQIVWQPPKRSSVSQEVIEAAVAELTALQTSVDMPKRKVPSVPTQTARFATLSQIPKKHPFSIVYLPLDVYDRATPAEKGRANGVVLPSVLYDRDLPWAKQALLRAKAQGVSHVLCGNVGHVALVRECGLALHVDFRANIHNSASLAQWAQWGAQDALLSPELILPQMRDIASSIPKGAIVYGRLPLMLLERPLKAAFLTDRKGVKFPVMQEGSSVPSGARDVLYNSVPLYMADAQPSLTQANLSYFHMIFTTESCRQVEQILSLFATQSAAPFAVRRLATKR